MNKVRQFILLNKRLCFMLAGGLILAGMILFVILGGFSTVDRLISQGRVEEAIAQYARIMEERPSAGTAKKMLKLAMDAKQPTLVLKVLKEHVHPHLEVAGMREEFLWGADWYLASYNYSREGLFWLAQVLPAIAPGDAGANSHFISYYEKINDPQELIRVGNILFSHWDLNPYCQRKYIDIFGSMMQGLPLTRMSLGSQAENLERVPGSITRIEAFETLPTYASLWLRACRGEVDGRFLTELEDLKGKPDPYNVYWRLRAAALLQNLAPGWKNPLGLDVGQELPLLLKELSAYQVEILNHVHSQLDTGNMENILAFMELVAREGLSPEWGRRALLALAQAKGVEYNDDLFPFILNKPGISLSPRGAALLDEMTRVYGHDYHFQSLLAPFKKTEIGSASVKFIRALNFQSWPEVSSIHPIILLQENTGVTLLNLTSWQANKYSGYQGALSPKGDQFVLMKTSEASTEIKIMAHDGSQVSQFKLSQGFPHRRVKTDFEDEEIFTAQICWDEPGFLNIYYTNNSYGQALEPLPSYNLSLAERKLREDDREGYIPPWLWLTGLDMYQTQDGLYDQKAKIIAPLLKGQDRYQFSSSGSEIFVQGGKLQFRDNQGVRTLVAGTEESGISWLAQVEDKIYLTFNSNLYQLNPNAGELTPVAAKKWYTTPAARLLGKTEEYVCPVFNYLPNWWYVHYKNEDHLSNLEVEGNVWPITFHELVHGIRLLKLGNRSFLIVQAGSDGNFPDCWILEFNH